MAQPLKFAAIDIGSNAIRLLITNVFEHTKETVYKKASLVRIPIRLGEDVFTQKIVSEGKLSKLVRSMHAYKTLMDVHGVIAYRACATSAMREAENGREVVSKIKEITGIEIEIIDGKIEAEIIFDTHIAEHLDPKKGYLYIDVGGGSTEVALFARGKHMTSNSFNIGTIRLLNDQVHKNDWKEMRLWLETILKEYSADAIIGSGGNINTLFKLSGNKTGKPLLQKKLKQLLDHISMYSYEERVEEMGLKPDRADVILPAGQIFTNIMKWSGVKKVFVPKIGLSDGIVQQLHGRYKKGELDEKELWTEGTV